MDLNQPVTAKDSKAKKGPYPTKTAINLAASQPSGGSKLTMAALFVVVLALIGIFAKFAVVDPLANSMGSSAEVAVARDQLAALQADNESYAAVNERYSRYVVTGLTEEEQNLADRDAVINLLETKVMGVGYLESLNVSGNVATVNLLGASLDQVSKLVESLEADERVLYVTVSTAQGEAAASTSATIQITFKGALDESGDEAAGAASAVGGDAAAVSGGGASGEGEGAQ